MTANRWASALLGVGVFVGVGTAADQIRINAAITAGGAYLKNRYSGQQPIPAGGGGLGDHALGIAALSGMAMMEAGVDRKDPSLQNVLRVVRGAALTDSQTYHVVLSILFLDRYGEASDIPMIQLLGIRLLNGLSPHGGWEYNCGMDITQQEAARLIAAFQQGGSSATPEQSKPQEPKPSNGFPQATKPAEKKDEPNTGRLHPEVVRYYQALRAGQLAGRAAGKGDNSNTQFGLIGLWVAARHGVPADDAFALIEARFLTTQSPADFGWGYAGLGNNSAMAMTCAGLLGLAVGAGRGKRAAEGPPKRDPKDERRGPKSDDPFYNAPGKKDDKEGPDLSGLPGTIVPGVGAAGRKKAIEAALGAIGRVIAATPNGQGLTNYTGIGDQYYTLWSVERVAVGYGLEEIGKSNWYDWGCNILIPQQQQSGSWNGKEGEEVSTSFAVLFLSKSNYVSDLTKTINKHFKGSEMRAGLGKELFAPQNPHGSAGPLATGNKPMPTAPVVLSPVDPPAPAPSGADKVAEILVASAKTGEWDAKLTEAKDTKGSEYTVGLARAIARLDGDRQKQAREALAERLTRMTADTLRKQMKDNDPELRRGASLAAAMKEDKKHIPDLIDRITDPSDIVVRTARAGLRSLTGKDFGPPVNADDAAKGKAKADWNRWYLTEGK